MNAVLQTVLGVLIGAVLVLAALNLRARRYQPPAHHEAALRSALKPPAQHHVSPPRELTAPGRPAGEPPRTPRPGHHHGRCHTTARFYEDGCSVIDDHTARRRHVFPAAGDGSDWDWDAWAKGLTQ